MLIGSIQFLMGGTWNLALGSAGLIASGVLIGKWFIEHDETKNKAGPPKAH